MRKFESSLRHLRGAWLAAARATSLVGLAADEDVELGLVGVKALRDALEVCETYQVGRARQAGWTWAQIAQVLEVTPQAVHQKHRSKAAKRRDQGNGSPASRRSSR